MKVIRLEKTDPAQYDVLEDELDELDVAIAYLKDCKHRADLAARAAAQARDEVLRIMEERGLKTAYTPLNNGLQCTVSHPETVVYDTTKLHEAISPRMWTAITDRVLNKKKLEDAFGRGKISGEVISACATVQPLAPRVLVTEHHEQEPEASAQGSH